MKIDLDKENSIQELPSKVRAVMGVPELILTDEIIISPIFKSRAEKYINSKISEYEDLDINLLQIVAVYYISYLLCPGMYARLPKQMENLSTKTILQSIDWNQLAEDLLNKCNDLIDEAIAELEDDVTYSATYAVLSDEATYPNENI